MMQGTMKTNFVAYLFVGFFNSKLQLLLFDLCIHVAKDIPFHI